MLLNITFKDGTTDESLLSSCREEASYILYNLPTDQMQEFDIHGIGIIVSNSATGERYTQPTGNINGIDSRMNILSQVMFHAIASVLGWESDGTFSMNDDTMACMLGKYSTGSDFRIINKPAMIKRQEEIKTRCGVYVDNSKSPPDLIGSITNIPGHWARSIAVMSYLMYLPRVWRSLYRPDINGLCNWGYKVEHRIPSLVTRHKTNTIWEIQMCNLMIPMWFTSFGKAAFWTFTYMLMDHMVKRHSSTSVYGEGTIYDSIYDNRIDGFISWTRKHVVGTDYHKLYTNLVQFGPGLFVAPTSYPIRGG